MRAQLHLRIRQRRDCSNWLPHRCRSASIPAQWLMKSVVASDSVPLQAHHHRPSYPRRQHSRRRHLRSHQILHRFRFLRPHWNRRPRLCRRPPPPAAPAAPPIRPAAGGSALLSEAQLAQKWMRCRKRSITSAIPSSVAPPADWRADSIPAVTHAAILSRALTKRMRAIQASLYSPRRAPIAGRTFGHPA
jgi:hypothetical protein